MARTDRQHLSFDDKVKILEERATKTKSPFMTVENGTVRAMVTLAKENYAKDSEAVRAVDALILRLEKDGRIGAPLSMAYRMLLGTYSTAP